MSTKFKYLLPVIILVLIVSLGFYVYFKNIQTSQQSTSGVAELSEKKSNEKLYKNEKYGFSFEIPNDSTEVVKINTHSEYQNLDSIGSANLETEMIGGGEETYLAVKNGFKINVMVTESPELTLKKLQDISKLGRGGPRYEDEKVVRVNGDHDALVYTLNYLNKSKTYTLWVIRGSNKWIEVTLSFKNIEGQEIFDNIISSFKFEN